jgi:3-(3-hydroxy-phenyl)propionate hydroxylase
MTEPRFDVAIVGFGPVGAVAACLLGQAGVKAVVIDKSDTVYDKPRAVALDHEIARVLQSLGLADAIAPYLEPFTDSRFYGVGGRLIKHLTMLPEPHPQSWTPSMVFMQPAVERLLRERAASLDGVEIRLGRTVTGFRQDAESVELDIDTPAGRESLSARYVIGCDGASSTIRRLAGLELDDLGFDQPWLVVDVLANAQGLARLPAASRQYCEPERPTTFVICTGNHRRWEIRLNDDEDPQHMAQAAEVWRLLGRWIAPEDGELWRCAAYRFHALVARNWRNGRMFIAGDAAHQQPPFLGQGLCQGIRDVANLSWKLALALRGEAADAVLDSYGVERASHVRKLTGIIKGIGGLVGERDPQRALERDEHLIAEAGGTIQPAPRQDLMPGLDAGLLCQAMDPGRGALFPQPWIETPAGRRRMDDVVGGGLRIVTTLSDSTERATMAAKARDLGASLVILSTDGASASGDGCLRECDRIAEAWLERHDAITALVRPDNYVFGVAASTGGFIGLADEWLAALARRLPV